MLPLANPNAKSGARMDDFASPGAAWTLTAHEARPGHELQFATMVERGVSFARAVFASNSTNAEGWGLYAEAIMLPYFPPEGQLFVLERSESFVAELLLVDSFELVFAGGRKFP